jgi:UDP-N-acetylglucosamine:LPS N-acetylglucosamine transferase
MNDIKICFASSSGGHTSESLQLQELRKKYPYFFLTEGTPNHKQGENAYYIKQINRKELKSIFYFFYLFVYSWKLLKKEKPTHIISSGAMCTFPVCLVGKLRGIKIIYIESFARVYSLSVTGRLVYLFADVFVVQWKQLLKNHPKAVYCGGLF